MLCVTFCMSRHVIARRFFRGATCAFIVVDIRMSKAAIYSVAFFVWMSVLCPLLPVVLIFYIANWLLYFVLLLDIKTIIKLWRDIYMIFTSLLLLKIHVTP